MGEQKRKSEAVLTGKAETCGSCRFFKRARAFQPIGWCRADPPRAILVGSSQDPVTKQVVPLVNTYWPQIPDTEWCGAWKMRGQIVEIDLSDLGQENMEGSA